MSSTASLRSIMSGSSSFTNPNKKDYATTAMKWESVKQFVYLLNSICDTNSFDIFSELSHDGQHVILYIFYQILFGMPYLFADFFIKQYTGKLDFAHQLNPLMKGITYGMFLQSAYKCIKDTQETKNSIRYISGIFSTPVPWEKCPINKNGSNDGCYKRDKLLDLCEKRVGKLKEYNTSVYRFYKCVTQTSAIDRDVLFSRSRSNITTNLFIYFIGWVSIFFLSSTTLCEIFVGKLARMVFLFKLNATLLTSISLIFISPEDVGRALRDMFTWKVKSYIKPSRMAAVMSGVGCLGIYDFGIMSSNTATDNAIVISTAILLLIGIMQSVIVKSLYLRLSRCLKVNKKKWKRVTMFMTIPMSLQLYDSNKLYYFYFYFTQIIQNILSQVLHIFMMSKLLNAEFRSIKTTHFAGMLCVSGFIVNWLVENYLAEVTYFGWRTACYIMGSLKMAVIMWVYGLDSFVTDIHFWLGFKPTKYWTMSWKICPLVLFLMFLETLIINLKYTKFQFKHYDTNMVARMWIFFTLVLVLVIWLKTISSYIVLGNCAGLVRCHPKYGPSEIEDRKRRKHYNETVDYRRCQHECMQLDDCFECNHNVVANKPESGSLQNIFESGFIQKRRISSQIEID